VKIAFTGTSSTGKTTLVRSLMQLSEFRQRFPTYLTADARKILEASGFHSMDAMTRSQLRSFQLSYFRSKQELERGQDQFITDRSFVDVAAYWVQRDAFDAPMDQEQLVLPCSAEARKYDIHFYFPHGLISFEQDGYRSNDLGFHERIDRQIQRFLVEWNLPYESICTANHQERVEAVLSRVKAILRLPA
jgi:nicotinamide riboside kinase